MFKLFLKKCLSVERFRPPPRFFLNSIALYPSRPKAFSLRNSSWAPLVTTSPTQKLRAPKAAQLRCAFAGGLPNNGDFQNPVHFPLLQLNHLIFELPPGAIRSLLYADFRDRGKDNTPLITKSIFFPPTEPSPP